MHIKYSIAATLMLVTNIYAGDVNLNNNSFRLTYDDVSLPDNENMGLSGINYLRHNGNFYYGMGLYGALKGKRGGFFSGGLEAGYQYPLFDNVLLDAGAFFGGGSGDGEKRFGNGLMIRSHAGILYDAKSYQVGASFTNVTFPNSDTNSNQIGFQLNLPFQTITTTTRNGNTIYQGLKGLYDTQFGWRNQYIAATYQQYSPSSKSRKKDGRSLEDTIGMIGFEYGHYINDNVYTFVEASEAASGDVAGYAEVLGGIGYDWKLNSNFGIKAKAAIGSGGGSGVDVQGGLLTKVNTGIYYKPIEPLTFSAELGYIDAPDGNFSAVNKKFMISYNMKLLSVGYNTKHVDTYKGAVANLWRMRFGVERYLGSKTIRNNDEKRAADLIVFKFDRFVNDNFYLTGQGFGAFRGDVSGYGGGLLGVGYQTDPFLGNLSAYGELLIGPGGAGGVNTGDGFLAHPMIGLNYKLNKSLDFQIGVGHVKALSSGTLDTNVIDAGLVYKFNTVEP